MANNMAAMLERIGTSIFAIACGPTESYFKLTHYPDSRGGGTKGRDAGKTGTSSFHSPKGPTMTKLTFAIAGAAALTLTLAGCGGSNEDALNTAEVNQANENLDAMAGTAADAANAEAAALGTQEQQLEQENAAAGTNPTDADEQNVAGM